MSEISKENIYFVNAHPDDINAGLGLALILTEIDHYRIHLVDFTRGERGLIEQGVSEAECAAIRTKEEEAVCRELGITPVFLHETDGNAYACRETCMELAEYFKVSPPPCNNYPLAIGYSSGPCDVCGCRYEGCQTCRNSSGTVFLPSKPSDSQYAG